MAEEKVLLVDKEANIAGGDAEYDLFERRMKYNTRSASCFSQYNHNCPVCRRPVVKMKGSSGWWACDRCQIRFIEDS